MNQLIFVVGTTALLGSALSGGAFFAFSSFVMKALVRVPSAEGMVASESMGGRLWRLPPYSANISRDDRYAYRLIQICC